MDPLNLILGITGSIAAYKMPEAIRLFRSANIGIRPVLTCSAEQFVTPFVLEVLAQQTVYRHDTHLDTSHKMAHIELSRWANHILIAPASAHFIAKLAHGFCDDLLSSLCLASKQPLWIAPAMNKSMWEAPSTQANIQTLKARGVIVLGPEEGVQACGDVGEGRMVSAKRMLEAITGPALSSFWKEKTVLITGGPTLEAIDPVRYLSNHSTGYMAYAIARAAQARGASVTLVSGPTQLNAPEGVKKITVTTAKQMLEAVLEESAHADIFIGVAAVADYRPTSPKKEKIKKGPASQEIQLTKNPDILTTLAKHPKRPKYILGFAAETQDLEENARRKLREKGLDAIMANPVGNGFGFGNQLHEGIFISRHQTYVTFKKAKKDELAIDLLRAIEEDFLKQFPSHK